MKPVSSVGIDCGPAAVMPNVGFRVSLVQVLSKALVSANGAEMLHLRMRWRCCRIYEYHDYSSGNIYNPNISLLSRRRPVAECHKVVLQYHE